MITGAARFVGREAELDVLTRAATRAGTGAQVLILTGEAGVGKSRLVREWDGRFTAGGGAVAYGHCFDFVDRPPALAPIRELTRDALSHLNERAYARVVEVVDRSHFGFPVPFAVTPGGGDTEPLAMASPELLYDSILQLLAGVASETPLAVVIEDLHWADGSTLDFVSNLVYGLRRAPLLVLLTTRSARTDPADRCRPVLAEMGRLEHVHTLEIGCLEISEVGLQLESILGEPPDPAFLAETYDRSGGNAFFTEEIGRARASGNPEIPRRLRDLLTVRFARCSPATIKTLRAASLTFGWMHPDLIGAATQAFDPALDSTAIDRARREALDHDILVSDPGTGGVRFRHALLREALEADLSPTERTRIHRGIAERLSIDPDLCIEGPQLLPALLAHHWRGAGDTYASFGAALVAARSARDLGSYSEAADHFGVAISTWDLIADAESRAGCDLVELARSAAACAYDASEYPASIEWLEQALTRIRPVDDGRRAAVLSQLSREYRQSGDTEESARALAESQQLLVGASTSRDQVLAQINCASEHVSRGQLSVARSHAEVAIRGAEELGLSDELANAWIVFGAAAAFAGDLTVGRSALGTAKQVAMTAKSPALHYFAGYTELMALNSNDHLASAPDLAAALMAEVETNCLGPSSRNEALLGALQVHLNLGDLDDVGRLLTQASETRLNAFGEVVRDVVATLYSLHSGELADATERSRDLARYVDRHVDPQSATDIFLARASVERAVGDIVEARRLIDSGIDIACTAEDGYFRRLLLLEAMRVEHAAAHGVGAGRGRGVATRERAERLVGAAISVNDADRRCLTALRAYRDDIFGCGSADAFEAAADEFEAAGLKLDALQLRIAEGQAALGAGERDRARTVLQTARITAETTQARWIQGIIEGCARRARFSLTEPATAAPSREFGVTDREIEVLALMARGQTNREIGERLFVSVKTVGTHVSHVLAKLGAANRSEASAIALRAGLIDTNDPID